MSAPAALQEPLKRRAVARLDGLDWLRAGAAVLVVVLHAGMAYLVVPMPGLAWSTHDPIGSPLVDGATWWINGFIMPLFFVQSGFLASTLMRSKGPRAFLVHRTRRLLGPFLLGCVLILPLDLYVWLLGWAADGKIPLRKLRSLKIESPLADNLWGVSHLWFLEYLWVFCVLAWGSCALAEWRSGRAAERQRTGSQARALGQRAVRITDLGLMGISALALWWEPQILIGFRHSWWPLPANLLFYGPWFALGWVAQLSQTGTSSYDSTGVVPLPAMRASQQIPFGVHCEWRIVAAVCAFAVLLPLIHRHIAAPSTGMQRAALVGLFTLHAWLMVTGLFGSCLRWLKTRPPQSVKYVAEASFWIYLFHHPVVGVTHVSLRQIHTSVEAKFLLTLLIGVLLPLLTYEVFVCRTWIGAVLHGRRSQPQPATPVESEQPRSLPTRRAA